MTPPTIPIVQVSGTHADVGRQLGEAGREAIRAEVERAFRTIPAGRSRNEQLALAARYRVVTEPSLPWLMEELDGCAAGAGVDRDAFFATTIEEIWYEPRITQGRCSDLVAGPPATSDGHLLVAHNNDRRRRSRRASSASRSGCRTSP